MAEQPVMSRRRFLTAGAAAAAAVALAPAARAATGGARVRWIAASPAGNRTGIDRANAAPMADLPRLVAAVGPGGSVLLDASRPISLGDRTSALVLASSGKPEAPITIRGAKPDGSEAIATIVSNRAAPWAPAGERGASWLELAGGSGHLTLRSIRFQDVRRPVWVTATVPGLTMSDIAASNIDRLLEVSRQAGSRARVPGSVPGLRVSNVVARGFTGPLLSLRAATDALIETVDADAGHLPTDYVTGVSLMGTDAESASRNVVIRHCNLRGFHGAAGDFLQGDGITTEPFDSDVTIRDTEIADCLDGGVDLKSAATVCQRVRVTNARRSFRYHQSASAGARLRLVDCVSIDPIGAGSRPQPAHLHTNGDLLVVRGSFADRDAEVWLVEVNEGASARFEGGEIYHEGPLQVDDHGGTVEGLDQLERLRSHP